MTNKLPRLFHEDIHKEITSVLSDENLLPAIPSIKIWTRHGSRSVPSCSREFNAKGAVVANDRNHARSDCTHSCVLFVTFHFEWNVDAFLENHRHVLSWFSTDQANKGNLDNFFQFGKNRGGGRGSVSAGKRSSDEGVSVSLFSFSLFKNKYQEICF